MSGPGGKLSSLCNKLSRKKCLADISDDTSLQRCLGVCDLVFMGVGGMVGSGIYVLVGIAAKEQAGPAILLSFVVAAVTIFLAAWCYAEFAARVPKTGSVYLYTYITLGEFPAFIMGWASLFAVINGVATNGRAWSAYLDSLTGDRIANWTETYVADWTVGEPIARYPDFVAAGVILFVTVIVSLGVQCSAKFTTVFGCINVAILVFASAVGFVYADIDNWTSKETGGFFPFGWSGVFAGAGACFWAFTGFEVISVSVEETKNPKKAIPVSMLISLLGVLLLYLCTAASVTLVTSYTEIDSEAPLPSAFGTRGIVWAKYIVSVGPLCGLTTTLFTGIYGFVRIAYAMSEDGLIFNFFSTVNQKTRVPVVSTILGGTLMALQAMFFDLKNIISFGVVLSLLTYILVDFCVIVLRYRPNGNQAKCSRKGANMFELDIPGDSMQSPLHWKIKKFRETSLNGHLTSGSLTNLLEDSGSVTSDDITNSGNNHSVENNHPGNSPDINNLSANSKHCDNLTNKFNTDTSNLISEDMTQESLTSDNMDHLESISQQSEEFHHIPSDPADTSVGELKPSFSRCLRCFSCLPPGECVFISAVLSVIAMCVLSLVLLYGHDAVSGAVWWVVAGLVGLLATLVLLQVTIVAHTQNLADLVVKVPCVPWLPSLSIMTCAFLMVSTATVTSWVGVAVVFTLGVLVYFGYSLSHSKLTAARDDVVVQEVVGDTVALLQDSGDEF